MKLTVWQQFSSNHSASFTVIGEFESAEAASKAAEEFKIILKQIKMGTLGSPYSEEGSTLTPTEIKLKDKYQIEWPASINWFNYRWEHRILPIVLHENLISIENPHPYIYTGPQPFNGIMEKLGAKVFLDVDISQTYPQTALLADFRFKLPSDDTKANELIAIFQADFENARKPYFDMSYEIKIDTGLETAHLEWDFVVKQRLLEMERDNAYLRVFGLTFGHGISWIEDFIRFDRYLENSGCTEIEYTFHSERHNWPPNP